MNDEKSALWMLASILALATVLAAPSARVFAGDRLVMYWDHQDPGEGVWMSGFEAPAWLEIPDYACGFRIGMHGETPDVGWSFHEKLTGAILTHGVKEYSSSAFPGLEGPIQAQGPVHACHGEGDFNFQVPLGLDSILGHEPVQHGAGSFAVDIDLATNLFWIDHAGQYYPHKDIWGPDPSGPRLPPEFIGESPSVDNDCLIDITNKKHCGMPPSPAAQAAPLPSERRLRARPGTRADVGVNDNPPIVPVGTSATPAAASGTIPPEGVACPVHLEVVGTIHRNPEFEPDPNVHAGHSLNPPIVEYRLYFVPEHVASTTFSVALEQDTTQVTHSVPIPLPITEDTPSGGIDQPTGRMGARMPSHPDDRVGPGRSGVRQPDPRMAGHPVPEHVFQGTVRLQLTNITDPAGNPVAISSPPSFYTIRCDNGDEPLPDDLPLLTMPLPAPPPEPPSGLAAPQPAEPAPGNTCLRGRIENGRCICPRGMRALPTAQPEVLQCLPVRGQRRD